MTRFAFAVHRAVRPAAAAVFLLLALWSGPAAALYDAPTGPTEIISADPLYLSSF